ncbi:MAG: beta-1,6-N-acetylglucosaminyltransferase [Pseudomonadota bacterium]|nr:beta-1,6-N-acetylglucosaminyltransferase [Pseudomonadota bacterium]
MRQVFLIHAHKDLAQLNALVGQLLDDEFLIYVNLDAKAAIDAAAVHPGARQVRRRIAIHWGDFSQVEATLHSMRQIVAEAGAFDKLVFLSGQDAPLLPNRRLKQALTALAGCELLDCVRVGAAGWPCDERYQYFHRDGAGALAQLACRAANRAMRLAGLERGMVNGWQAWGGSSWWTLSRACVAAIVAQVRDDPAIVRFFRSVSCADELFFQTLVMNSPFGARVLPHNFRHIQWSAAGARNPKVLDAGDFEAIRAADAHFCRKLDGTASAALLPLLRALRESRAP